MHAKETGLNLKTVELPLDFGICDVEFDGLDRHQLPELLIISQIGEICQGREGASNW